MTSCIDDIDLFTEIARRVNELLMPYVDADLRPERVHTVVNAALVAALGIAEANLYYGASLDCAQRAALWFHHGDPN